MNNEETNVFAYYEMREAVMKRLGEYDRTVAKLDKKLKKEQKKLAAFAGRLADDFEPDTRVLGYKLSAIVTRGDVRNLVEEMNTDLACYEIDLLKDEIKKCPDQKDRQRLEIVADFWDYMDEEGKQAFLENIQACQ